MSDKTVLIIAGEASGDIHGANLIREMKKLMPDLQFFGIGGEKMKNEGVELLYDIKQMALIGVAEVIRHIPFVYKAINNIISLVKEKNPELIILIDYPGFNIRLGKKLKKLKKKIYYYISPQVWAWGSGRIKKIAEITDKMAVILPFEEEIYKNAGIDVSYVGHPLIDITRTDVTKKEFLEKCRLSEGKITIGLLPGSRIQEIEKLLPEMMKTINILEKRIGSLQAIISTSPMIEKSLYDKIINENFPINTAHRYSYTIMKYSDMLIVASGTATLEAAVFGTPMVIVYKVSPLTYFLCKLFIKISNIGIVNIIAKKNIIPEIIQKKSIAEETAETVEKILKSPEIMSKMRDDLKEVKKMLGNPGASKRAAELALQLLNKK